MLKVSLFNFSILISFQTLVDCRKDICEKLSLSLENVELSMGMSSDFEEAVSEGIFYLIQREMFIVS